MRYDFIEIGTSDFDTQIQNCDDNTIGLSIEPIKYYLDRLPNKKNVKKVNCAISDYNGFVDVYYLSDETIKKFNLPSYVKGQNSIGKPHPENFAWTRIGLTVDDITKTNVTVKNFETIVKEFNVESIDYLKIDTEGHDCVILNDYINFCEKEPNLFANKIEFESNILSNQNEVKNIIDKLINFNYTLIQTGENTILVK